MDRESLQTASKYLNNLLLARGLLRNSEAIDFVKPSKESRAQIINLVHDLILREDRDKEQREQVADTIRQLRSENARKTYDIDRLTTKGEESTRALVQAQKAERVAAAGAKNAERATKALQDHTAKLKTTLAQVKAQHANDIKKRDLELARLKTHLQGQQRGMRTGMTAPSMTVKRAVVEPSVHDLTDPAYTLRQETTEFLTQLSQSLSDENDGLISLLRSALATLHDLLGLPETAQNPLDSAIGSMGSNQATAVKHKGGSSILHAPPITYAALSADLESTLDHLKTVLTNPNFVSLEEVEERDEEIVRLQKGWEHMEQRWREVLGMMRGWVQRMNTGQTINIDDLRIGMGLVSPSRPSRGGRQIEEDQGTERGHESTASDTSEVLPPVYEDRDRIVRIPSPGQTQSQLVASDSVNSLSSTLEQLNSPKKKRDAFEPLDVSDFRPSTTRTSVRNSTKSALTPAALKDPEPETPDADESEEEGEEEEIPNPPMSITEKLHAAQAAAELLGDGNPASRLPKTDAQPELQKPAPVTGNPRAKKSHIRGRPRKRKSTLSPEELEALIGDF